MDYNKLLYLIGAVVLIVVGLVFELLDYRRSEDDSAKTKIKRRIKILGVLFAFVIAYGVLLMRYGNILWSYLIGWYFILFVENRITLAVYDAIMLLWLIVNVVSYIAEKKTEKKLIKRKQLIRRSIFLIVLLAVVNGLSFLLEGTVQGLIIVKNAVVICICIWLISRLWKTHKSKHNFSKFAFCACSVVTIMIALGITLWNTFAYSPILFELAKEFMQLNV